MLGFFHTHIFHFGADLMGIDNYRFSSKKRRAIMDGETVDLHLYIYHYRGGDYRRASWYGDNKTIARIERGFELAEDALEKSTSKLCVRGDDWDSVKDGTEVYLVDQKYSWSDVEERSVGKVVGFVKRVGKRIHIVRNIDWYPTGTVGEHLTGPSAGIRYEVSRRVSFDEKGPYSETRYNFENGETKTEKYHYGE